MFIVFTSVYNIPCGFINKISEAGKLATFCQIESNLCALEADRLGNKHPHSEQALKACLSLVPIIKGNFLASGGG